MVETTTCFLGAVVPAAAFEVVLDGTVLAGEVVEEEALAEVVVGTCVVVTLTLDPSWTWTVPGASEGLTSIMTAPERYFITSSA